MLFLQAVFVIDQVNSKRSPDRLQDNYTGRETKPFNKVNYTYKTSLGASLSIFKIVIDHSNVTNSWLTILKEPYDIVPFDCLIATHRFMR